MPNWKKVIVSGSDARISTLFTSGHVTASGNVSGSSASTASFGRVQTSVIGGNSPLKIESDDFNVSTDGSVSGSSTSTGSFAAVQAIGGGQYGGVIPLKVQNTSATLTGVFQGSTLTEFEIRSGTNTSRSIIYLGRPNRQWAGQIWYDHNMEVMRFAASGDTERLRLSSTGATVYNGALIVNDSGDATNPAVQIGGTNDGIFHDSDGMKFQVNNATRFTMDDSGNFLPTGNVSGSSTSTGSFGIAKVAGKDIKPDGVARDQVLKWNGNQFVPAAYDDTFVFTIADFDMNFSSSPQLIGAGVWKQVDALTFTATYNNGPPDGWNGSAEGAPKIVTYVDGSTSGSDMFPLSSSFASGTNNIAIAYPPNSSDDIRFRLYASAGSDTSNDYTDQRIYFRNHFVWGDSSKNNGFTQSDIQSLATANSAVSSDTSRTITTAIGTSNYLAFAHRTGDTNVAQVRCGTGNNVLTVAMDRTDATTITPLKETVSYTNSAGKNENFYVYASKLQNIDAHSTTFITVTSTQKKNYIYWGTESSWTNNETNVEALANKNSSLDDGSITGNTLSVGSFTSKYVIVAIPARYGDNDTNYQFKDNSTNLPFSFNQQSDVTITNAVGFQEDYSVYRSTNLLTMNNAIVLIATV